MFNIETAIEFIEREYERLLEQNNCLQNENIHLRLERYKDDELAEMKKTVDNLYSRIRHYGLDEESWKKLMDWWNKHVEEDHLHCVCKIKQTPSYTIQIEEFAECTCYSIICNKCKKSYDVFL